MKPYLVSLAVGLLAGLLYAVLKVKSPAPPTIALVGLLGMLIGEQAIGYGQRLFGLGQPPAATQPAATQPADSGVSKP